MAAPHFRRRVSGSLAAGLAAALCAAVLACAEPPPEQRLVLITVDTLRADSLNPRRMPRTFAFAERGLRFERCYAASSATQPTHASLFTGQHPWEHGVGRNGVPLGPEHETVAERLRAQGFATAAVVASFALERRFGLDQGFDQYDQLFEHMLVRGDWRGEDVEGRRFYGLGPPVVDRAVAALEALPGPKQFLWLHVFDPHEPYGDAAGGDVAYPARIRALASAGELERGHLRYARRLYNADVTALDGVLGAFLERLERDAPAVETHVVFTSDHGESFGEDGSFTHGYRVSPEQIHVPCVIVSPGLAPALRPDRAGSRDLAPTLLSLVGLDPAGFPGRDLTRPPPADLPEVVGMSGEYGETPELRTDGREVAATSPRYYAVVGDHLWAGDATTLREDDRDDRPLEGPRAAPLRDQFATFDEQRQRNEAPLLQDPTTEEALKALGYFE